MLDLRPIPSHPGYKARSDGVILGKKGAPLRQFAGTGGYLRFTTYEGGRWQQVSTHVTVCEAFYGVRPDGHHAAHRNGDQTDNRAENLRWASKEENEADKRLHGRSMDGERNHQAKLTSTDVAEIRSRKTLLRQEADRYGVSISMISKIRRGEAWTC